MLSSRVALLPAAALVLGLLAACSAEYDTADFVGTFEDGEGGAVVLQPDGTGTLFGLHTDSPEREGTWELIEGEESSDFVMFAFDELGPEVSSAANEQIWIESEDELYLLPEGPDSNVKHDFERVDEG